MTTNDISSSHDISVWNRIKMTAFYYKPIFKKQTAINLAVASAISIMAYAGYICHLPSLLCGGIISFLALMFYLAPMVLARCDDRMVVTMLPATAFEKWLVIITYFFIITPAVILFPPLCMQIVSNIFTPGINMFRHLFLDKIDGIHFNRLYLSNQMIPSAICLWGMVYFRKSRTIKTLITMAGAFLALTFSCAVFGITVSYRVIQNSAFYSMAAGGNISDAAAEAIRNRILSSFQPFYNIIGIISIIIFLVMLWRIYHTIKTQQI